MPLQITESTASFQKKILQAFAEELNDVLPSVRQNIESAIKNNTAPFLLNTKEVVSLFDGVLKQHFGLPKGEQGPRVNKIVQTIVNNIEVTFDRVSVVGNQLNGGFTVGVLIEDFSDILALPEAYVITEKNQKLPWLQWLIIEGDRIIITDYEIAFGNYYASRAGGAIMRKIYNGIWRVPPEFSGTVNNNWLTRALISSSDSYIDMISNVMEVELSKVF